MRKLLTLVACASIILSLTTGCASTKDHVLDASEQTQLQKRSYQSREFETSDRERVLRTIIATLQDLGFVIDRADLALGAVSGTKVAQGQLVKATVSVRPKGKDRIVVRANAQFHVKPIEDPKHYQDFFVSLEKSLFLTAHAAD